MNVESAFEANTQLAEAREPGVSALHDPAVLAQALAALDTSPGDSTFDAPLSQMCSAPSVVIALVHMQLDRSLARPARQPFDGRHGIDASLEHLGVVTVGPVDQHHQQDAARIYDEMTLGAKLAPIGGIEACLLAPRGLGGEDPSMQARCQSYMDAPLPSSQFMRARRSRLHPYIRTLMRLAPPSLMGFAG